jgi:hypothetical protein
MDAPSVAFGLSITIEAAMVRARKQRSRRIPMATIGTFKKTCPNEFPGEIVTLSAQTKNVRIIPESTRSGDNTPSHGVRIEDTPNPTSMGPGSPRSEVVSDAIAGSTPLSDAGMLEIESAGPRVRSSGPDDVAALRLMLTHFGRRA